MAITELNQPPRAQGLVPSVAKAVGRGARLRAQPEPCRVGAASPAPGGGICCPCDSHMDLNAAPHWPTNVCVSHGSPAWDGTA